MIELADKNGEALYRWEIGRTVTGFTGNVAQFSNAGDSLSMAIKVEDGSPVRIPDRYLATGKTVVVCDVETGTKDEETGVGDEEKVISVKVFPVKDRAKPKNYTPTQAEEAYGAVKELSDAAKAAAASAEESMRRAEEANVMAAGYAERASVSAKEAEEVVQEVESVKSAFNISSEEIPGSENILDPSLQEVGTLPTTPTVGEELVRQDQPESGRLRTKATQIEVDPGEILYLYLNAESASSNVIFYYCDADKKYISLATINLSKIIEMQETETPSKITIPSGVKYIDFSIGGNGGAIDFSKFCISRTKLTGFTEWVEPEEVLHVMVKEECVPDLPYVKNDIFHERPARSINILDPGNQYAELGDFEVVDGKLTPKPSTVRHRTNEPIPIKPGTLYLYARVTGIDAASESSVQLYYLDESENWLRTDTLKYKAIIANGFVQTPRISSKCTHIHVVVAGSKYSFKNVCISYEPTYEFSEYNAGVEETIDASKLPDQVSHPLVGKTIVNLGDSITGMRRAPVDISTELAIRTGAKVYNCGFGGCRMAAHNIAAYDAFSMYRLADEIVKDSTDETKWADQENYVENNTDDSADPGGLKEEATSLAAHFRLSLDNLKALDFSKVDVITIAYGTNDFTANVTIENPDDLYDTTTFAGAFRYSVEKLLSKYPHLKVFVCGQTFRFWINSTTEEITTSDVRLNGNGAKLEQFVEKTKLLTEEYHLPFIDLYNVGMNIHNRTRYFTDTDGTHPLPEGLRMIAGKMAKEMF